MTAAAEVAAAFDLSLTDDQQLVQRTARDFATNEVLPKEASAAGN